MAFIPVSVIVFFAATLVLRDVAAENVTSSDVSCSDVRQVFVMKGIGLSQLVPDTRTKGDDLEICPSSLTCCSKSMEEKYQEQVKKDFKIMLQSSGSYLKTLITTSATKFKDTFLDMVQVSENSTNVLFSDVYQLMESFAKVPLGQLFADLLAYISGQDVDLEDRVDSFFDSLFPLAFHHSVNARQKEFTETYKECLREVQQEVRPFGDLPDKIRTHIVRSFEAARTFLEALQVGVEVINTTEHMDFGPECRKALVKLNYCSHCQSLLQSKPCTGLCLNVVRGCLASVSELDSSWSEYVSALERLTSGMVGTYNIEQVLTTLDTKISETIMYVMENTPEITKRVKQKCGHFRRVTRDVSETTVAPTTSRPPDSFVRTSHSPRSVSFSDSTSLYILLQNFVAKVAESKDFYSNLADSLCSGDNPTTKTGQRCWNGQMLGEYAKTIAGVGITAQKYNPEMKPPRVRDMAVNTLVEKLQLVRQKLASRVTSVPQSDSSVIVDGSGSGGLFNSDDEDYTFGSGSGDYNREDKTDIHSGKTISDNTAKTPSSASVLRPECLVLSYLLLVLLSHLYRRTIFSQ